MFAKTLGAAFLALGLAAACGPAAREVVTPASGNVSIGPADAKVVVVEYGSPTCPGCKSWHDQFWAPLKSTYVDTGKVRFEFRELAVHGAIDAAIFAVARCAGEEDYFAVLDEAFARQNDIVRAASGPEGPRPQLKALGAKFRLSAEQVESCIGDPAILKHVSDMQTESRARGVESTPTFFINDKEVANPRFEVMSVQIDALLAGEAPPAETPAPEHVHTPGDEH